MQALVAGQVAASDTVVQNAAGFIKSMQRSDGKSHGGFQDTTLGYANAPSTAWAIEGLHAAAINPAGLAKGSPYTFLASLRQKNGSSYEFPGDLGDVMDATMQATIALSGKTLPIPHGPNVLTRFDPSFTTGSVVPKSGARFASRTVEIRAAYHDNVNGTGVDRKAVGVAVDGKSKTKAAHIYTTHLNLQLTKLSNGSHTFVITVHDWAGNAVRVERSFTVAVPTGGGSTGGGTHPASTGSSSGSSGAAPAPAPWCTTRLHRPPRRRSPRPRAPPPASP